MNKMAYKIPKEKKENVYEVRMSVAIDMKNGKVRTQNLIGGMLGQETIGEFKTISEAKKYYKKAGFKVYSK
jgi:phosphoribosylformimino-5-aminoimidazole carboxamide ribonucleotide (ProFAR) isomerase